MLTDVFKMTIVSLVGNKSQIGNNMNNEESALREMEASLSALPWAECEVEPGVSCASGSRPDAVATLTLDNGARLDVCLEVGRFPTLASLDRSARRLKAVSADLERAPVLFSSYFSEPKQRYLQDMGANYIDAVGNAHIIAPGVFIDCSGKKPKSTASSVQSFFSDKATLVPRLLFPGEAMGVRQMSQCLSDSGFPLSPGYVSKTIASLEQAHYAVQAEGRKTKLVARKLLLDDWSEAYRHKARAHSGEGWFLPEPDAALLAETVGAAVAEVGALTSLAGAHFVDPFAAFSAVDIVPKRYAAVCEALRALGAEPVERGANINVLDPVYPVSSFYGVRTVEGVSVVSDLQLFLDLSCQSQRGSESADHLFDRKIKPILSRGDQDDDSTE